MNKVSKYANALQQFEELVGGRGAVIDCLEAAGSLSKKEQYFLALLTDPNRSSHSLISLSKDAGLTVAAALDLFRSATFARAHALALSRLAEALPEVADDIATKAVDGNVTCPDCRGKSSIGMPCGLCRNTGLVFRESTLDHQKLALETLGILKKGAGVNVQVNQQVNASSQSGNFFSKYVKDSDSSAYDIDDVIDIEKDPHE